MRVSDEELANAISYWDEEDCDEGEELHEKIDGIEALMNAADEELARYERMETALREIADHGCDNAAPKTCKETYPTNREEWCAACIATSVLGGNHD